MQQSFVSGSCNCLMHVFVDCWGTFFHIVGQRTKIITAYGSLFLEPQCLWLPAEEMEREHGEVTPIS